MFAKADWFKKKGRLKGTSQINALYPRLQPLFSLISLHFFLKKNISLDDIVSRMNASKQKEKITYMPVVKI